MRPRRLHGCGTGRRDTLVLAQPPVLTSASASTAAAVATVATFSLLCSVAEAAPYPIPIDAAAFPTPPNDGPITPMISSPAETVCTDTDITPLAHPPDYEKCCGTVGRGSGLIEIQAAAWVGPIYLRPFEKRGPPLALVKGSVYTVAMELALAGSLAGLPGVPGTRTPGGVAGQQPTSLPLVRPPELLLFRPGTSFGKDSFMWPHNITVERPQELVGGSTAPMVAEASVGGGYVRYRATLTSPISFSDTAKSLQVLLSPLPSLTPLVYKVRRFCVSRLAEQRTAAPRFTPPGAPYTERVAYVRPSEPGPEVFQKAACPYDAPGLLEWSAVFGLRSQGTLVVPGGKRVVVGSASVPRGARFDKVVVPRGSELVFRDEAITLSVRALLVNGRLVIGGEGCRMQGPIRIEFWGDAAGRDADLDGHGSKGMAVVGDDAEAEVWGRRYHPTWTRLSRPARAGDTRVYLQEPANWHEGQEIVVMTTARDDTGVEVPRQNEVHTVRAVDVLASTNETVVALRSPLVHNHYAGLEYQAEVALLSRAVNLEGVPSDADGYGGHALFSCRRARIAGVATRWMGQRGRMGRYPLHLHMMGAANGTSISDCAVRDSYFRCVVVHGTNEATATQNVAFNASGSCFYLEDGVEENNTISYNLAAAVDVIGDAAAGDADRGVVAASSKSLVQPSDVSASCFYFSNAHNTIVGNAASGGWAGFGFPGLPAPLGVHSAADVEPRSRPLLRFRGNTAHSSGWSWSSGAAVYFGGTLRVDSHANQTLVWESGRSERNTRLEARRGLGRWQGTPVFQRLEDLRVFGSNRGVLHWGDRVELVGFEMTDVARAATLFGSAWLSDGLVTGASANEDGFANEHHDGFQFYDTFVKTVLTNVHFRNYQPFAGNPTACKLPPLVGRPPWTLNSSVCARTERGPQYNVVFSALTNDDRFKPQQISAARNIRFTNVDRRLRIGTKSLENGASRFFNMIDFDGTVTATLQPTIVGSHLPWWRVCDDCVYNDDWGTWLCPKKPPSVFADAEEREVAYIDLRTPDIAAADGGIGAAGWTGCAGVSPAKGDYSNCDVGYAALWGHGPQYGTTLRSVNITSNEGITGVTGTGWWVWLNRGAPKRLTIRPSQIPEKATLRFATNYPSGTTFQVTGFDATGRVANATYTKAYSLAQAVAQPLTYYVNEETFYMRLRLPQQLARGRFEREGAWVQTVVESYTITIVASCAADDAGFCVDKPPERIPPWGEPCPARSTSAPVTDAPSGGAATPSPAGGGPPAGGGGTATAVATPSMVAGATATVADTAGGAAAEPATPTLAAAAAGGATATETETVVDEEAVGAAPSDEDEGDGFPMWGVVILVFVAVLCGAAVWRLLLGDKQESTFNKQKEEGGVNSFNVEPFVSGFSTAREVPFVPLEGTPSMNPLGSQGSGLLLGMGGLGGSSGGLLRSVRPGESREICLL